MNSDRLLRDYLDGLLTASAGVGRDPDDRSDATPGPDDLPERLRRAERCQALLASVWGTDDRSTPPAEPESVPSSSCPPDELALERLGPFEIRRLLGHGGMGSVFLAFDQRVEREVALKIPHAGLLLQNQTRLRFLREAKVAGRLEHPNLVPIFEAGEVDGTFFIASAYCPGPTLAEWIRTKQGPVDLHLAANLIATLAAAIQHAHQRGVLHRDLKPGNVLLDPVDPSVAISSGADDFAYSPRIADFGLADLDGDSSITVTGLPLGTAKYMSPEQASGERDLVGPPADIYALGVILFELLCGVSPFQETTISGTLLAIHRDHPPLPRKFRPELPRDLEAICLKCLEKDPACRYLSAAELQEDLLRWTQNLPTRARPLHLVERLTRSARRAPALAALTVVSVLAITGLFFGLSFYSRAVTRHARELEDSLTIVQRQQKITRSALLDAKRSKALADRERAFADQQRRRAVASELLARQMSYRSDIQRAFERRALNQLDDVSELLARHVPADGARDVRGLEWSLLRAETQPIQTLGYHEGPATECVVLPGDRAATAGADGEVKIWNLADASLLQTFTPQIGPIHAMALSPDQKVLAIGGQPSLQTFDLARVYLLNVETGERLRAVQRHHTTIESITFSRDGRLIAAGSRYAKVDVSTIDGEVIYTGKTTRRSESLAFSPDDQYLNYIVRPNDVETIRIAHLATGKEEDIVQYPGIRQVHCSPDARYQAIVSGGEAAVNLLTIAATPAQVFRLTTREPRARELGCMRFATDGRSAVAGDVAGTLHWWAIPQSDVSADRLPPVELPSTRSLQVHADRINAVAISATGKVVAVSDDGCVRLVDPKAGLQTFRTSEFGVTAADIGDAGRLVIGCTDGKVRSLHLASGAIEEMFSVSGKPLHDVRVQDDEMVTVLNSGRIDVRDAHSGEIRWTPLVEPAGSAGEDPHMMVAWSPDGEWLAATGTDNLVHLWNRKAREKHLTHQLTCDGKAVTFSADGSLLASASDRIEVFNCATGEKLYESASPNMAYCVQFDPAMQWIASGHWDRSVRLADMRQPGKLRVLRGHGAAVEAVAFSFDGGSLMSLDGDNVLRFWDVETGEPLGEVPDLQTVTEVDNDFLKALVMPSSLVCVEGNGLQGSAIRWWMLETTVGQP